MAFTHLHVHTEYSILDGSNKIAEYVKRVKELGMTHAAITDHGVMYGVIEFYKAAKAAGITPILGCEIYVAPNSRFDREASRGEDRYYHLVLLAENNKGYQNLMKIVSKGFVEGFYYKPRVDKEVLEQYAEGIIATSACLGGEVQQYLLKGMYQEAKEAALEYQRIFGKGNFFLELQDHGLEAQKGVNQKLMLLHQDTGIEMVATNDVHYTYAEDAEPHDILLCLQTQKKLSDEDRMRYEGGQYFVKSEEEMRALFPYVPEALDNTQKIADRCNVEIEFGVTKLPKYEVPDGYDSWEYLNDLCKNGLRERYETITDELEQRLNYELSVIKEMGYVDYFLIVWDFIHYARSQGIPVGPGRGSAAGSIVSYTLGITQLDPLKYDLLFERFLNPERVSMPDIDIDFCYERRQEVIDYVGRKYGKDRVVQIVTFGTMAAKGAIRDVARVMEYPYSVGNDLAKMIPQELGITIRKALRGNAQLRERYEADPDTKRIIDMSIRLEGLPRNTSMHAAGVVISQKDVDEYVPLSKNAENQITTQFTMTTLEELGLLKMDFLGLRTLTVISDAVAHIKTTAGIELDMEQINYDDKAVLSSLWSGKTDGVFQLESAGMKNFMKELKAESLDDVIAGISLYRPGPMDFIPNYIKGKNNPQEIHYDCPQLEPILKSTYGCIVYQEQVMQIVRDLAGYTMGRSDLVRRAMSKKKGSVMEQERKNFVYGNEAEGVVGCIANGISEEVANKIYDDMIDFAKYAFNKSHAAAYAIVSYQTAYLKYYYPAEFMAALLTSVADRTDKITQYIDVCRRMDIAVLPPNVNEGKPYFSVELLPDGKKAVRYSLTSAKSVGTTVIEQMVAEREAHGNYTSLKDFISRLSGKEANKRTIEALIKAGAFDDFGYSRRQLMLTYSDIIDSVNKEKKDSISGQMSLFDFVSESEWEVLEVQIPNVSEYPKEELLAMEKEVLGIYVSGHPLDGYRNLMKETITKDSRKFVLDEEHRAYGVSDGSCEIIGGMIAEKKILYTKKTHQPMAFLTIEDLFGIVETVVFPNQYKRYAPLLEENEKVFLRGTVSIEDDKDAKLLVEEVIGFHQSKHEIWVQFQDMTMYRKHVGELEELIDSSDGSDEVVVFLRSEKAVKRYGVKNGVLLSPNITEDFTELFGRENIKIVDKGVSFSTARRT